MLPAVEEARAAQLAKWDAWLPQYPKWTFGGDLELEESDPVNGQPVVRVTVGGAGAAELRAYVESLKADGFVPFYSGDSDIYYKVVDGVCRSFDKTDAAQSDFLSFSFFVGDYDRRAAARAEAEEKERLAKENARLAAEKAVGNAKDTAKAAASAAKGLFKKLF